MKVVPCVQCGIHIEVQGSADRAWCVSCLLDGDSIPITGAYSATNSPRTERFQARLI